MATAPLKDFSGKSCKEKQRVSPLDGVSTRKQRAAPVREQALPVVIGSPPIKIEPRDQGYNTGTSVDLLKVEPLEQVDNAIVSQLKTEAHEEDQGYCGCDGASPDTPVKQEASGGGAARGGGSPGGSGPADPHSRGSDSPESDDSAYDTPERGERAGRRDGVRHPAVRVLQFSPQKARPYSSLEYPWPLIGHLRHLLQLDDDPNNVLELFQDWTLCERISDITDCPCGKKGIRDVHCLKREVGESGRVLEIRIGNKCVNFFRGQAEEAQLGLTALPRRPLLAKYLKRTKSSYGKYRYEFKVYPEPGNPLFTREVVGFLRDILDFVFIYYSSQTDREWTIETKIHWSAEVATVPPVKEFVVGQKYEIKMIPEFYHAPYGSGINLNITEAVEC